MSSGLQKIQNGHHFYVQGFICRLLIPPSCNAALSQHNAALQHCSSINAALFQHYCSMTQVHQCSSSTMLPCSSSPAYLQHDNSNTSKKHAANAAYAAMQHCCIYAAFTQQISSIISISAAYFQHNLNI